ncbi:unnamed protein product [Taenia asiatica]|uniref:Secreted protein n=1 Tax=Taenia asiatica TaxID=60517 RepID=A0A0R3WAF7_TAEAS|nr:unnamed protein product [Taenia asiatica]
MLITRFSFAYFKAKDCLDLDETCGGWNHKPCCPGLTCRKVRDGNTYGRCSFSLLELHYPTTTATTTTTSTIGSTKPSVGTPL